MHYRCEFIYLYNLCPPGRTAGLAAGMAASAGTPSPTSTRPRSRLGFSPHSGAVELAGPAGGAGLAGFPTWSTLAWNHDTCDNPHLGDEVEPDSVAGGAESEADQPAVAGQQEEDQEDGEQEEQPRLPVHCRVNSQHRHQCDQK